MISEYLKILTDREVKGFLAINFGEYFKSTRAKLYSKLGEEKSLREVAKLFYNSSWASDEEEKYVEIIEKTTDAKNYDPITIFWWLCKSL